MNYGLSRARLLDVLATVMDVPETGRSAFLGRFQHLQRLSLVEGVNPGRGKAASYDVGQILHITIAFQLIQLGLPPERAVNLMKFNKEEILLALIFAEDGDGRRLNRSFLSFDPALLSRLSDQQIGRAETTFWACQNDELKRRVESLVWGQMVTRMAFINVATTIENFMTALDGKPIYNDLSDPPELEEAGVEFRAAFAEWASEARKPWQRHGNP